MNSQNNSQINTLKGQLQAILGVVASMEKTLSTMDMDPDRTRPDQSVPAQVTTTAPIIPSSLTRMPLEVTFTWISGCLKSGPATVRQLFTRRTADGFPVTIPAVQTALFLMSKKGLVTKVGGFKWGLVKDGAVPTQPTRPVLPFVEPAKEPVPSYKSGNLTPDDVLEVLPKEPFRVAKVRRLLYKAGYGDRTGASVHGHLTKLKAMGKVMHLARQQWTVAPTTGVFSNGVKP